METGETLIAAVGTIGGVGGAIFAWVQARTAIGSRHDAQAAQSEAEEAQKKAEHARDEALELSRKATVAAERQAAAQEEANRLEIEARRAHDRTGPQYVNDSMNSWRNTSGRDIIVLGSETYPKGAARFAGIQANDFPLAVPAGGSLRTARLRAMGIQPDFALVHWRYDDEEEGAVRETRFPFV